MISLTVNHICVWEVSPIYGRTYMTVIYWIHVRPHMIICITHIWTIIYERCALITYMIICCTHILTVIYDSHIPGTCTTTYDHMHCPYMCKHIWQAYMIHYMIIWMQPYMWIIYCHTYMCTHMCARMVVTHDSHMCAVIYDSLTQSYTNTFFARIWLSYMF